MASATQHPNHNLISSEDVEGTEVYDAAGTNIGEVDHLMIDKVSGRVGYAVISFGGFMGLGHSHYPVPWGALKYDTSLGGFRTSISQRQLKYAPEFSVDVVLADPESVSDTATFEKAAGRIGAEVVFGRVGASRRRPVHDPLLLAAAYHDIFGNS